MSFLSENILKDINKKEHLEQSIESVRSVKKGEIRCNQFMPEKEPVLKNMDEIKVNSGLNQHGEDQLTEKRLIFLTPVENFLCVQRE